MILDCFLCLKKRRQLPSLSLSKLVVEGGLLSYPGKVREGCWSQQFFWAQRMGDSLYLLTWKLYQV